MLYIYSHCLWSIHSALHDSHPFHEWLKHQNSNKSVHESTLLQFHRDWMTLPQIQVIFFFSFPCIQHVQRQAHTWLLPKNCAVCRGIVGALSLFLHIPGVVHSVIFNSMWSHAYTAYSAVPNDTHTHTCHLHVTYMIWDIQEEKKKLSEKDT